jgi:hypothetical protein
VTPVGAGVWSRPSYTQVQPQNPPRLVQMHAGGQKPPQVPPPWSPQTGGDTHAQLPAIVGPKKSETQTWPDGQLPPQAGALSGPQTGGSVVVVVEEVELVVLLLVVVVPGTGGQPCSTGFVAEKKKGPLFMISLSGPYWTQ